MISLLCCTALKAQVARQHAPPGIQHQSKWVHIDPSSGRLHYRTTERGDRIMDFSQAGYMGGGVSLPKVKTAAIVQPVQGDNTVRIQEAIDSVGRLPLRNQHGFRGAVELSAGVFTCAGTLRMDSSGVVLRGQGEATILRMMGAPHLCVHMGDAAEARYSEQRFGHPVTVTDPYIPSGTYSLHVTSTNGLREGDEIIITKPVTSNWVHFMKMDSLSRNGKPETWIKGDLVTQRRIKKITGKQLTLEVPLTDSYDSKFTGAGTTVQRIKINEERRQIGLEDFVIMAPESSVTISQDHFSAIRTSGLADCWIRNINIHNTVNSIALSGKRITVEQVRISHDLPTKGAAKPADLAANGSQILINKCRIQGDNVFYLATGAKVSGPVVLLHCTFTGKGWIQPHQRWATGLLIDGCQVPDGGIDFMNRGEMGSGHGWAIGWAVAWNCLAKSYINQSPPGVCNFVIGSTGERQQKPMPFQKAPVLREGIYDSHGLAVAPESLYLAQLRSRLGSKALQEIGY